MVKAVFADYNNCLVNLSCSILSEFGVHASHPTLPAADRLLGKGYRNIVVLLLDGMGVGVMKDHLEADGFFRSNVAAEFRSVFPPTTTAATTSFLSGLTPFETGWLGWKQYFRETDQIVIPFQNIEYYTGLCAAVSNTAGTFIPYRSIFEKIGEAGNGKAYHVSPHGTIRADRFGELKEAVKMLCAQEGRKFIYAYWPQPDSLMHERGSQSLCVTQELRSLERETEAMAGELTDTLLFVTADHGHQDLTYYTLTDYPEILNMLKRPVALEARACVFYVKEEFKAAFPAAFASAFGKDFLLFSKEEVREQMLFGGGKEHPEFEGFIGDYLAAGIGEKGIRYSEDVPRFVSDHAGLSAREMNIPLIAIERN